VLREKACHGDHRKPAILELRQPKLIEVTAVLRRVAEREEAKITRLAVAATNPELGRKGETLECGSRNVRCVVALW